MLVEAVESFLRGALEGHEGVVFLAPMGAHNAIAVEAWQAVEQWGVQRVTTSEPDDGTSKETPSQRESDELCAGDDGERGAVRG